MCRRALNPRAQPRRIPNDEVQTFGSQLHATVATPVQVISRLTCSPRRRSYFASVYLRHSAWLLHAVHHGRIDQRCGNRHPNYYNFCLKCRPAGIQCAAAVRPRTVELRPPGSSSITDQHAPRNALVIITWIPRRASYAADCAGTLRSHADRRHFRPPHSRFPALQLHILLATRRSIPRTVFVRGAATRSVRRFIRSLAVVPCLRARASMAIIVRHQRRSPKRAGLVHSFLINLAIRGEHLAVSTSTMCHCRARKNGREVRGGR